MLSAPELGGVDAAGLFNQSPNPYVILDRELRIVGMNEAYLAATGRSREAIIGQGMFDAFPAEPGSLPERMLRGSLEKVLESAKTDHLALIPYPIAGEAGAMEERYWSATHTPVFDADGEVAFVLQHTTDVTELHRLRQGAVDPEMRVQTQIMARADAVNTRNLALGEESGYLRALFETAPSFMAVLSGPDHVFDIANAAYQRLVGRSDLIGKPVRKALPEIKGQGFFEILDRVYATGEPFNATAAQVFLNDAEAEGTKERYLDFIFQPVRGPDGAVTGIFVQGHDVTEQKRAEALAKAGEERFRSLAQSMPTHVWTADADGRLDWFNDRVLDYYGVADQSLAGEHWVEAVHSDDRERARAAWSEAVRTGEPYSIEFRLTGADGEPRWHIARAVAQKDETGRVLRWIGTSTDIHDQKRVEEALEALNAHLEDRVEERTAELLTAQEALKQSQKMEAIGTLAGGIAHDFNNLLQAIGGSLQLVSRELEEASPAAARIETALNAVRRGGDLTSQLLAFSRRTPLQTRAVNLPALIEGLADMLARSLGEGVALTLDVEDGVGAALADPGQIENALLNLAINARDAMDGHGALTVTARNAAPEGEDADGFVMIAVSDTGPGMPPEIAEKVFEPFFTTKPEGKGTGLGLSMVYGFAKQSGGFVEVDSAPGEGAAIRIYLPRTDAAETPAETRRDTEIRGGTETVLVAEDDPAVRDIAVGMLAGLGYRTLEAKDADAAMALIESGARIDLLFTDVVMPGKLKSAELARAAAERLPGLRVLFTSGYAEDDIVHDGRLDAGVRLLNKPYEREALAIKVREALDAEPAGEERAAAGHAPVCEADASGAGALTVLLCEDEPIIRLNAATTLKDAGYAVIEAETGAEAQAALAAGAVDLLIVDLGLPDMSGADLAEDARRTRADMPVIFATGRRDETLAERAPGALFLAKPYDDDALLDHVRQAAGAKAESTS